MDELRQAAVTSALLRLIRQKTNRLGRRVRIMEVCGTHTMTVYRYGLNPLLQAAGIDLLSGPGCPVCITPDEYHEAIIDLLTQRPKTVVASFGDMTRVPTQKGSLQTVAPAPASRLKIIYSPMEAVDLALTHPEEEVVLFAAGFETTIPSIAITVKEAKKKGLLNFSLLAALWLIPPPIRAILEGGEVALDGFLYPGHVSTIIGWVPYRFVAEDFGIPGTITGFEPNDVLLGVISILDQLLTNKPKVEIEYRRAVPPDGNLKALAVMGEVFEPKDAFWRGLGLIPLSGLRLRPEYQDFEASARFSLDVTSLRAKKTEPACRCGEVLRGILQPEECPLFGTSCRPESPYGPCMVSYEGACLIHFKYNRPGKEK